VQRACCATCSGIPPTEHDVPVVLQVQLMDEKSLRKMLNTFEKKVGWGC
jgi:hypothetical protein